MGVLSSVLSAAAMQRFRVKLGKDPVVREERGRMNRPGADYGNVSRYAVRLGELASESLMEAVEADPPTYWFDEHEAAELLSPMLREVRRLIAYAVDDVQNGLNRAAGLGLKAVRPPYPEDRAAGLAKKLASYADYADARWVLGEPIVTFAQGVADDAVRVNVEAHALAGLYPTVQRVADNEKCPWCAERAGIYGYPPTPDVFERHERCRCSIRFTPTKERQLSRPAALLYAQAEKKARAARIQRVLDAERGPTIAE